VTLVKSPLVTRLAAKAGEAVIPVATARAMIEERMLEPFFMVPSTEKFVAKARQLRIPKRKFIRLQA
jgi:hypothetical protein